MPPRLCEVDVIINEKLSAFSISWTGGRGGDVFYLSFLSVELFASLFLLHLCFFENPILFRMWVI